jgi:hypothetical protein
MNLPTFAQLNFFRVARFYSNLQHWHVACQSLSLDAQHFVMSAMAAKILLEGYFRFSNPAMGKAMGDHVENRWVPIAKRDAETFFFGGFKEKR